MPVDDTAVPIPATPLSGVGQGRALTFGQGPRGSNDQVLLTFSNVNFTVQTRLDGKPAGIIDRLKKTTATKSLLQDVKGEVTSGQVLAIMGPSGAGKTTLLNMLALTRKGGVPSGHVRVNGRPLTIGLYNELCAYVEQFDTLWAALTVRDHLYYALALYQPVLDAAAREAAIDELIKDVGLADSQHIRAGNQFMRGLSGGNMRRLSIAIALAKRPSVLFLDEPTSGVDSASAVRMMTFLKEIAESARIAVVCTIHQPPASVFAGFDTTMVLSMGRVTYSGKASAMGEYISAVLGRTVPTDTNLAEYVLDLVNKDFTPEAGVREILAKWAAHGGKPYGVEERAVEPAASASAAPARASFFSQLLLLTKRSIMVAMREPLAYVLRLVANFSTTLLLSIIYVKTREHEQEQVLSRTFFLMFCMGIPMQFILVSVYLYYYQWLSLKKEVKDGMYHPAASALASWVVQVPMMFLLAAAALLPMWAVTDIHWPNFPMSLLIYAVTFWSFEGMAQMLAVAPNVVIGLFGYLNLYFAAFLFCGMFDP